MTGLTVVAAPQPQPPAGNTDTLRLLRFAMANPRFTREDVEQAFGWDQRHFYAVVRLLREALSEQAENLVCTPDPGDPRGPWVYRLTTDAATTRAWHANRLDDCETRMSTMVSVARSAMTAHGARTRTGRRARIIFTGISHAIDNLRLLDDAV